jgi:hypothetical protein
MEDYEKRSLSKFPPDWKIPLLKQILPKEHKKELELRFSMGEKNFEKIAANIVGYSNDERVKAQRAKHANDMDVDNLEAQKVQTATQDHEQYVKELEAYYYDEDPDLSWLGPGKGKGKWQKKGSKGKGKGKYQKGDKGAGKDGKAGKGQGSETRKCHHCQKVGHLKWECRSFLAGKPKVIANLEPGDWEAEAEDEEDAGYLDEEITPLEEESDGEGESDGEESESWDRDDIDDDDDEDDDDGSIAQTPQTPAITGNVLRSPLIHKEGSIIGSPLGETVGESLTESIRKGQLEIRELLLKASPTSISTSTSTMPSTATATSCSTSSIKDIGKPPGIKMSKSQKKKSKKTKKNLIKVLMESSDVSNSESSHECKICNDYNKIPPKTFQDSETQSIITLPHTQKDILWTPNGMKPVVDIDADEEDSDDDDYLTSLQKKKKKK